MGKWLHAMNQDGVAQLTEVSQRQCKIILLHFLLRSAFHAILVHIKFQLQCILFDDGTFFNLILT